MLDVGRDGLLFYNPAQAVLKSEAHSGRDTISNIRI